MGEPSTPAPAGASLVWTSILATATVVGIIVVAVIRFTGAFTNAGLSLEVPIPESFGAQHAPSGASLQVTQAIVTVTGADAGLVTLVCGTILLAAIAGIAVVVCYLLLTVEVSRSRTFSRRSIRMLSALSAIILIATTGCYLLDSAIARAVRTAAGLGEVGAITSLSYWMAFAIVGALGLIAYAFRKGAALQRETEGLV